MGVSRTSVPDHLRSRPSSRPPVVPDGRYAVQFELGPVLFFKVNTPESGKWANYTFVEIQASDEFFPVRAADRRRDILEAIAEDPQRAATLYGKELRICGICGRTLTKKESRKRGIGPICAERMGW